MGSTLVKEGCVAGTQWVGSVTGMVGSINAVAWTASWSNFYNRFPVGPYSVTGLVDLLTLDLPQYPYQGRVKEGRGLAGDPNGSLSRAGTGNIQHKGSRPGHLLLAS